MCSIIYMSKKLKDKIERNTKKFYATNEKYGIFTPEILEFLGESFITAPASTMKSLHNAFPGGLLDHIITTTKYAVDINLTLPEEEFILFKEETKKEKDERK